MGVDHGGTGGQVPPRIWSGGTLMQITQKWAFCGLQNTPKSVFGRGSAPDPARGARSRRSPRPLSPLERGHPSPYPTPTRHGPTFGARHVFPQKSSLIYACEFDLETCNLGVTLAFLWIYCGINAAKCVNNLSILTVTGDSTLSLHREP